MLVVERKQAVLRCWNRLRGGRRLRPIRGGGEFRVFVKRELSALVSGSSRSEVPSRAPSRYSRISAATPLGCTKESFPVCHRSGLVGDRPHRLHDVGRE